MILSNIARQTHDSLTKSQEFVNKETKMINGMCLCEQINNLQGGMNKK
jgi:hypothetical protein